MKAIYVQILLALRFVGENYGYPGGGITQQICGKNVHYYCPSDDSCQPRSDRCTNQETCVYLNSDDKCFRNCSKPGSYIVKVGHALLPFQRPKRGLQGCSRFEHRFIQYRGFIYEFSRSGVEILDNNDPDYKYKDNKFINRRDFTNVGSSFCTWEETTTFINTWSNMKYKLLTQNCQHFVTALQRYLITGICAQPHSSSPHLLHNASYIPTKCVDSPDTLLSTNTATHVNINIIILCIYSLCIH